MSVLLAFLLVLAFQDSFSFSFSENAQLYWEHEIFVNGENGIDSESCLQGDLHFSCATINMALRGLRYNSTVIRVSPGTYTLKQGSETTITAKNQVAIIGSSYGDTVIQCSQFAGLVFNLSQNVTVESITFSHCGQDIFFSFGIGYPTLLLQAGVYMMFCENLTLNSIIVQFANGTGLFLLGNAGSITIENCSVSNCKSVDTGHNLAKKLLVGGGILIINGQRTTYYQINRSNITHNNFPAEFDGCNSIGGGGIVLISDGRLKIRIDSCIMANNSRGLFIPSVSHYLIDITNSSILSNQQNNVVRVREGGFLHLNMSNVDMDETLAVYTSKTSNAITQSTKGGYTITTKEMYISIRHLITIEYNYPRIDLEHTDCDNKGKCSDDGRDNTGRCPAPYSGCLGTSGYCLCAGDHTGRLCGQCKDGLSVAINSHYLACTSCDNIQTVLKGWAALIGIEFVPLTVMIVLIAVLNVNLSQGSLNAYIFFCQILTLSFPSVKYPAWLVSDKPYMELDYILNVPLIPFSMWNLDFINIPSSSWYSTYYIDFPICVSSSTTPLGALSFWYFIAFYPIFLLTLFYGCIVLYDRGHRCVTCVVRPVHRLLARIWRLFDIKPSLSQTVASVYTLCFTQLAAISFKILHPVQYQEESGDTITVFFYDGTQQYFKGPHGVAGTLAIIVLVFLGIVTIYLLIYPFKWFQHCLNRIKFKKDFLISVADVFIGPYKDGTQNSWDYRYFAGIHFGLRLVIMMLYYIPLYLFPVVLIASLETVLCVVTATAVMIFRPYKREIHSFNEMCLLLVLGLLSFCYIYPDPSSVLQSPKYIDWSWFSLLVLPLCGFIIVFLVAPYCVAQTLACK